MVEAFLRDEPLSPLQIVAFAYVGVMTLPFVFRAQWDYFLWFFFFLLGGIPVFYFYLPMYAFWHMDDLSWGKTRQVQPGKKSESGEAKPESVVPRKEPGSTMRGESGEKQTTSSSDGLASTTTMAEF
jgi:chitin synthase